MAYAEAMAHGLPVIGTTAGAIPDTVPPDAGVLVEPNDVKALTRTLRMLIENPKERQWFASGARAAAAALPTWRELGEAVWPARSRRWHELQRRLARAARALRSPRAQRGGARCGRRRRSPAGRRSRSSISPAAPARHSARSRPRIEARQNWRLVDNDLSLLARAPQSSPPDVNVTTVPIDLNRDLEAALDGPVDLVTTSALLDLVSDEWLERLAVETAARRLPVYAALSYDGRIEMTPADAADEKIIAAVNAHQRTDKGFGPALGPEAAQPAIERFERVGYSVVQGASDWVFAPDRSRNPDSRCCRAGRPRRARSAMCRCADVIGWLTRRRDLVAAGRSSIRVGHVDFFARPTATR